MQAVSAFYSQGLERVEVASTMIPSNLSFTTCSQQGVIEEIVTRKFLEVSTYQGDEAQVDNIQ